MGFVPTSGLLDLCQSPGGIGLHLLLATSAAESDKLVGDDHVDRAAHGIKRLTADHAGIQRIVLGLLLYHGLVERLDVLGGFCADLLLARRAAEDEETVTDDGERILIGIA